MCTPLRLSTLAVVSTVATLALGSGNAFAAKQTVDFIGGSGTFGGQFNAGKAVTVNLGGVGPADQGDVYVIDGHNRVQRFGRDDNGTLADSSDDTYFFISAWGADVVQPGGTGDLGDEGDANYEICVAATECKAGVPSGGNGTTAGNGTLSNSLLYDGIAVDQDTGNVYVADTGNNRLNVYEGDGTFLRSFGFDVVGSGPGGFEICEAADGDICEAGTAGAGVGQIDPSPANFNSEGDIAISQPDGNSTSGTVFFTDRGNHRINTYALDGSSPSSIGSAAVFTNGSPERIAVDSRGIVYASEALEGTMAEIERYDSEGANGPVGFLAPIETGTGEVQEVAVDATEGAFRLSFEGDTTVDMSVGIPANDTVGDDVIRSVTDALAALPSVGSDNNVFVSGLGTIGSPYLIQFEFGLGAKDVSEVVASSGTPPLDGGSGVSVATAVAGKPGLAPTCCTGGLVVDPDSDGGGPDTDVLYVLRGPGRSVVQQFGPVNQPGLTAPPSLDDDRHGTNHVYTNSPVGIAVDESAGHLYVGAQGGEAGPGVYVLGDTGPPPTASIDSVTDVTATSATVNATVNPNGPPQLSYYLEYSLDGTEWVQMPSILLGTQTTPQAVSPPLDPPGSGLAPNTFYHVRLVAQRPFASPVITGELTFTTDPAAPIIETVGAPHRTTTTAELNGRVNPRNSATSFHFEYVTEAAFQATGFTDLSSGGSTALQPAGSDGTTKLVAAEVEGLTPDTAYRYRLVADNGNPGSPIEGAGIPVRTRASDEPLTHGDLPGPPGSDRAWEQISLPDTGGNPVAGGIGFSADGDRALYSVNGGTPITDVGSLANFLFAERVESAPHTGGWHSRQISPPRSELVGQIWNSPAATGDLSSLVTANFEPTSTGKASLWRLEPDGAPARLVDLASVDQYFEHYLLSADGSRALALLSGSLDPAYPAANAANFYDISVPGSPKLASLLPGETVASCGVGTSVKEQPQRWGHGISADGSHAFFTSQGTACSGTPQLYVRDFEAGLTRLVSGPAVSGSLCEIGFLKGTQEGAFFVTGSRLVPEDTPGDCEAHTDIYRYDAALDDLECVTCGVPGLNTNVDTGSNDIDAAFVAIAVADDGSRLYFSSPNALLPGAGSGAYRLDVASGELAYIAPGIQVGLSPGGGNALSPDGSVLIFYSSSPFLDPIGGTSANGGTGQYYRYDDTDRSIVCASCPQDGSEPVESIRLPIVPRNAPEMGITPLAADGDTFAFATATALVSGDQNSPAGGAAPASGTDVYEWRDGRLLLVTDGLSNWFCPDESFACLGAPLVNGVSPTGRDVFFTAAARYTADAIDAYTRLYDARIGGGFEFPKPPPPCPLEVCQGTPKGAPEDPAPASSTFSGPGNQRETNPRKPPRCGKGQRRVRRGGKARCVRKAQHRKRGKRRANTDRRSQR